jgi:hypothetical protein
MRWLAVLCLLVRVAGASPRATDADARRRLSEAMVEVKAHVHALRYEAAREAAEGALAIGAAGAAEVGELARVLGEVNAALGDDAAAERWFAVWLAVEPRAALPDGTSPKVTERLAAARARGAALGIRGQLAEGRVAFLVEGDPDGVVAGAVVTAIDAGGARREIAAAPPVELRVDAGTVTAAVSLRDRAGNELFATELAARAVDTPDPVTTAPGRRRAGLRAQWPWLAGVALAAGAGGVFVWRRAVARDDLADILAHSEEHTFAEADAARARAERYGWLSVGGFAVAGALAATAIILSTREVEVAPLVTPTATGVSARVAF